MAHRRRYLPVGGGALLLILALARCGGSDDVPPSVAATDGDLVVTTAVEPLPGTTITTVHPADGDLLVFGVDEGTRQSLVWRSVDGAPPEIEAEIEVVGTPFVYQVVDTPSGLLAVGELVFDEAGSSDPLFLRRDEQLDWWVTADPTLLGVPEADEIVTGVVEDGSGGWFAVGPKFTDDGVRAGVWESADGVGWNTVATTGLAPGSALWAIVRQPDGYFAVGESDAGEGARPELFTSGDGVRWEAIGFPLHADGGGYLADVVAFDDGLVGGGVTFDGAALLAVSGDGRRWRSIAASVWLGRPPLEEVVDVVSDGAGGVYLVGRAGDEWRVERLTMG